MLLGRMLGHEQHEHAPYRPAIRRIECDRGLEAGERATRFAQPLDAAVRYGDSLPKARRAELLARVQAARDRIPRHAVPVLEQAPECGEQFALRSGVEIGKNVRRGQELGDRIHRGGARNRAPR